VIYNDIGSDIGLWKDTTGRPLHAHGGGLYTEGETFFWIGDVGRMTADVPYFDSYSIAMYSSADLSNWQLLSSSILNKSAFIGLKDLAGHIITASDHVELQRPKLIQSATTGRYVLPACFDLSGKSGMVAASSASIAGAYKVERCFYTNPKGLVNGDLTVVTDAEQHFLVADTSGHKYMGISQLAGEGLEVLKSDCVTVQCNGSSSCTMFSNKTTAGELPALFRSLANDRAYLWTSPLAGWAPAPAMFYEGGAGNLCGSAQSFKLLGNPSLSDTTHNTQSTFNQPIVHADNSTTLLYMSDRWCPGGWSWMGQPHPACGPNVSDSVYVWLPL
jgi:hypothetical protein